MSDNPFRFRRPLDPEALIGRQHELAEIVRMFGEARNFAMVAPRGTGKTALLQAALHHPDSRWAQAIYVDLFPAINTRRFAEIYASALTLAPTSTVEAMQEAVQQLVPTIVPRVVVTGSGKPGLQLDLWDRERDIRVLVERILNAPAVMAEAADKPIVVVFDDFEDLLSVGDTQLLQSLAQVIRKHRHVAYVFVLRKDATAEKHFNQPRSPFYRLADSVRLDPIPAEELVVGFERRFRDLGVSVDPDILFGLLEFSRSVPHNAQILAHSLFEEARAKGAASDADLRAALSHVLEAGAYAYKSQWDQLAPHQRNLVLAIAQGHTERLHSQQMVFQLGLGSPSTVSKNLRTLTDREILQKQDKHISFVDPFFGLWLQRRMT